MVNATETQHVRSGRWASAQHYRLVPLPSTTRASSVTGNAPSRMEKYGPVPPSTMQVILTLRMYFQTYEDPPHRQLSRMLRSASKGASQVSGEDMGIRVKAGV